MALHKLVPLMKKRKRVGRGGSRGGTAGKGHKGQKARSGGSVKPGFEGGQMPLYRRLPKRGFTNAPFKTEVKTINVGRLNELFNEGDVVTKELLVEKGAIKPRANKRYVLKILADGTLTKKLTIHADACSHSAQELIEKVGGQVRISKES